MVLAICVMSAQAGIARAASQEWVATWAQAMTSSFTCARSTDAHALTATCDIASEHDPILRKATLRKATLRQVVRASLGGNVVRIRLSNYFGRMPLTVSAAHVALAGGPAGGFTIAPASDRGLTFSGRDSVTIAPGAVVTSDAVRLRVPSLARMVISLYFAGAAPLADVHAMEHASTAAAVAGDAVGADSLRGRTDVIGTLGKDARHHVYVLDEVDVHASPGTRAIVAFGDSITDGAYASAPDKTWPGVLAQLADANAKPAAVINMGISGNELTVDQPGNPGYGVSALKRFERDVIERAGVTDVVVLLGINDVDRGTDAAGFPNGASFGAIVAGYRMLIDIAHAHHLKIYAGTMTPFAGFRAPGWYSPPKEAIRARVNRWIRTSSAFDGVIDFSHELAGAYKPGPLAARQVPLPPGLASICAGDTGLHPNDRGYAVMGTFAYDTLFSGHLLPRRGCR